MANNYLEFSQVILRLTTEEEAWLKSQLEQICVIDGVQWPAAALSDELKSKESQWLGCRAYYDMEDYDEDFGDEAGFEWEFCSDVSRGDWDRYLWLYSVEHADLDRVAYLAQKFLNKFRPNDIWSLTYANYCTKPRVGEFSGGTLVVTATEIKSFDAYDFVEEQTKIFREAEKDDSANNSVALAPCRIVVSICGGVIQDIYCSDTHARTVVIDWDTEGCEPSANGIVEMRDPSGRDIYVYVADFHTQPMNDLSGTEIKEALGAANCQDILQGPEGGAA